MRHFRAVTAAAVVVGAVMLAIGCGSGRGAGSAAAGTGASAAPAASPTTSLLAVAPGWPATAVGDFVKTIDNPWFPLVRSRSWVSVGVKDGRPTVDTYTVTGQTKQIMGVTASVIRDRLTTHGRVIEATWDWYAQDKQGNVWYLGEDTKEYDAAGKVTSTAGSWQTGVDGAAAGIYMPADPQVGVGGYQEYLAGQALDHYRVVSTNASIKVPYGAFGDVLQTRETTALEPGNVDAKYYVKGIGQVAERTMKGPQETSLLSRLTR